MKTRSLIGFLLSSGFILGLSLTAFVGYPILEPNTPGHENQGIVAHAGDNAVPLENPVDGSSQAAASPGLPVIDAGLYKAPAHTTPTPSRAERVSTAEENRILVSSL